MTTIAKIIELIGESKVSWDDAMRNAVREAAKTVDNISAVEKEMKNGITQIDATLNAQDEFGQLDLVAKRRLLLVTGRPGALDALMAARPGQGALRSHELALAAEVAPAQDELDQFAHLHRIDGLGDRCHPPSFRRCSPHGNRIVGLNITRPGWLCGPQNPIP